MRRIRVCSVEDTLRKRCRLLGLGTQGGEEDKQRPHQDSHRAQSLLNPVTPGDIIPRQLSLGGGGGQPKVTQDLRAEFRQGLLGPTRPWYCALAMSSWEEMGLTQLPLYLKSRMKGRAVTSSGLLGAILRKQGRCWVCLRLLCLQGPENVNC